MNGNRILFDSNVIIDASKGKLDLIKLMDNDPKCFISIITYTEILAFQFIHQEELEIINEIISNLEIVEYNLEIADITIQLKRKGKIKLPDAIILATAKFLNATLITSDIYDFNNIDDSIKIMKPMRN